MPHTPDAVPHLSRYRRTPPLPAPTLRVARAACCLRCLRRSRSRSRLQLPSFCPRFLAPDPTLPRPSQPLMRCRTMEYIAHDCDSAGRWAWWGTACCRSAKMRQARKATDRIDSYSMRKRNRARRQPCSFPLARDAAGHHHAAAVAQKSDSSYSIQPPQTETFKTTGYCVSIWRRQFRPHMWQCRLPYQASQGKGRSRLNTQWGTREVLIYPRAGLADQNTSSLWPKARYATRRRMGPLGSETCRIADSESAAFSSVPGTPRPQFTKQTPKTLTLPYRYPVHVDRRCVKRTRPLPSSQLLACQDDNHPRLLSLHPIRLTLIYGN
jgi:hypothetical protein